MVILQKEPGGKILKKPCWFDKSSPLVKKIQKEKEPLFPSIGCPAKKYIQLKISVFKKAWNKFKQIFHGCKNISLSSFGSICWLNILGHYLILI